MYPVPAACGARLTILPPPTSTLGMVHACCLPLMTLSGLLFAFPTMEGKDIAEKALPVRQKG